MIELLIALGIFVILTGIFVFGYNTMNSQMTTENLAHQIAISAKTAQTYALGVKGKLVSGVSEFPGYGLHFDRANPGGFLLFIDLDGDQRYDPGSGCGAVDSECEESFTLRGGNTISALCGDVTGESHVSADCGGDDTSEWFDIVFTRPDPDAVITGDPAGAGARGYAFGVIRILSPRGFVREVEIWTTGQISIR